MLVGRGLSTVLADLAEMGYDARWDIVGAHHVAAPHQRNRIWVLAWDSNRFDEQEVRGVCRRETSNPCEICSAMGDSNLPHVKGKSLSRRVYSEHSNINRRSKHGEARENVGDSMCERQPRQGQSWFRSDPAEKGERETDYAFSERIGHIWGIKSPLGRVANGVAARVDRLRCIGNGQVPAVAQLAWNTLKQ